MGRGAFQQKVVVITGGCAGIGRALALRFAQAGAHLDHHHALLTADIDGLHNREIDAGVVFWGYEEEGELIGGRSHLDEHRALEDLPLW